jgi:RNase P subunit RPR2
MVPKFFLIHSYVCPKCKESLWTGLSEISLKNKRKKNLKFLAIKKPKFFYCPNCDTHFNEYLQEQSKKKKKVLSYERRAAF